MDGDRIVKIDDKEYVLRKFGIGEKIRIKDGTMDAWGNVKLGTLQLRILAASLVSWNYHDANGNLIPPNEKNIVKFLHPDHFDELTEAAISLNEISLMEKKTLQNAPARHSDGQLKHTEDSNSEESTALDEER
jgi:hypothetical protein